MAYTEWGDGDNPDIVLCVHGLTRNGRDFDYLANHLSAKYRVICPDIVGRGKSSWLKHEENYNYATYLADILFLLKTICTEPVNYVGTSMGGIIGMMIAGNRTPAADLIKKLVINDVGAHIHAASLKRIAKYVGVNPIFDNLEQAEKYLRNLYSSFGISKEEDWHYFIRHSLAVFGEDKFTLAYDPAIAYMFKQHIEMEMGDVDLWPMWNEVTCPVLLLRGETSDILPQNIAKEMVENKPGTDFVEFKGMGHAPSLMLPEQIHLISDWLGR
jgi:pimeloyl-ACP methyl ester carboxylesterase